MEHRHRRLGFVAERKGPTTVIFGEPDTARFLTAVKRLKQQLRRQQRQTHRAKQRVRALLRKIRAC